MAGTSPAMTEDEKPCPRLPVAKICVGRAEIGMDFSAVRFQILRYGKIRPDQALSAVGLAVGACPAAGGRGSAQAAVLRMRPPRPPEIRCGSMAQGRAAAAEIT